MPSATTQKSSSRHASPRRHASIGWKRRELYPDADPEQSEGEAEGSSVEQALGESHRRSFGAFAPQDKLNGSAWLTSRRSARGRRRNVWVPALQPAHGRPKGRPPHRTKSYSSFSQQWARGVLPKRLRSRQPATKLSCSRSSSARSDTRSISRTSPKSARRARQRVFQMRL